MFTHSEHRDCSNLPEDEKTTHEVALARCNCLMERYLRWKKRDYTKSVWCLRIVLFSTTVTPLILLRPKAHALGVDDNFIGAIVSAVAAFTTGLSAISGWRENYIRYGYMWHALQSEKYRYLTRATEEYSDSDDEKRETDARAFGRRIEELVMAEVADWRAAAERFEQQNHNGKPTNQ